MEQLTLSQYAAILPGIFCIFLILWTLLLKKKNKQLAEQLIETTITLQVTQKLLGELQDKQTQNNAFQESLSVAELTTKLQKPRLDAQNYETTDSGSSAPGKYSNIQALAKQGMTVEEIASVLAISTHEAQQLVNLSKLAQGNAADNVAD